ncbi:hypothetical protein ANN_07944 [Periplaneta americana]|uniref:HAT C-terminal dimerisation domain-containing protein n=1 Tax=Periplaneta americana TaxID=6978 RepID=A0ABQ8T1F4_PERAM|nr:hypothetical protein ANN_07944 [Periplaneta americana]
MFYQVLPRTREGMQQRCWSLSTYLVQNRLGGNGEEHGRGKSRRKKNKKKVLTHPQTIRENTEILLEASKAIGLEGNPENTKYVIMSRDQNIVQNGNIKIGDLSFEEVEKLKYFGATVTNINDTREENKRRINMGNACYYSVEKLLSSSLLSKNVEVRIYKTVILLVLYGCETWTLTLREEQRLRVFENKVLRKIFGAKRDEVTGELRKLHNAELHALYSSPDIIRNIKCKRLRWAGHVARMGESRNRYRMLVRRPEGERSLWRPRRRWEDNIKMDLREVGYNDRDWINLAQDWDQKGGNAHDQRTSDWFTREGLVENTPIFCMFMVCAMEVPCVPSLNINDAFRTEGYHIEEYLLCMGLDERLGILKDLEHDISLYVDPFSADVRMMRLDLQFELIDLQCDVAMKARCTDLTDVELFKSLSKNKYPKLRSFACSVEAMFATTYVCEKIFSIMKIVKTKCRSRLTDKHLRDQLRLAVNDLIPDFEGLTQRHSEDS